MRRALVLSGGGCRGAFEVGALDYLIREAGEDYHIFLGTSVGALNAALIGQAQGRGELIKLVGLLKEIWLNLKGSRSVFAGSVLGPARLFSDALLIAGPEFSASSWSDSCLALYQGLRGGHGDRGTFVCLQQKSWAKGGFFPLCFGQRQYTPILPGSGH